MKLRPPDRPRQQQQPIFVAQQGTQIALGGQDQDTSAVWLGLLQLLQGQGRDQTILALEKARREDQFKLENSRIDIEENLSGLTA